MSKIIIIDPGHGGFDPGAVYGNRREKDDNLRLALAVGQELENAGYDIVYTRKDDRYDSPYDKAQIGNNAGGDLFLSFHRNFAERADLYQGVQSLVYDKNPLALQVSKNINEELEKIGFQNLGIESRKELVVLRRTNMPAVLLEVGFINSAKDNQLFDEKFSEITNAIATGVADALPLNNTRAANTSPNTMPNNMERPNNMNMGDNMDRPTNMNMNNNNMNGNMDSRMMDDMRLSLQGIQCEILPNRPTPPLDIPAASPNRPAPLPLPTPTPEPRMWYYVQVGLFRYPENAVYLMEQLRQQGYSSVWKRVGGLIAIWVGPMESLDEAVAMQTRLQTDGYETLIVTGDYVTKK